MLFTILTFYYSFTTDNSNMLQQFRMAEERKEEENLFSFAIFRAPRWSDFFWSVEPVSKPKGDAIITTVLDYKSENLWF